MKAKGSITIEASFILPILLLAVLTVIFLGVYMHDMSCMQSVANHAALHASSIIQKDTHYELRLEQGLYFNHFNEQKFNDKMNAFIIEQLEPMLINQIHNRLDIDCIIENKIVYKKVHITITYPFKTPFDRINNIFFPKSKNKVMQAQAHAQLYDPTEVINTYEAIDDISSDIVFIQPIKKAYQEIIDKIITTLVQ